MTSKHDFCLVSKKNTGFWTRCSSISTVYHSNKISASDISRKSAGCMLKGVSTRIVNFDFPYGYTIALWSLHCMSSQEDATVHFYTSSWLILGKEPSFSETFPLYFPERPYLSWLARQESKNPTGFHSLTFIALFLNLLRALSDTCTCFGTNPQGPKRRDLSLAPGCPLPERRPVLSTKNLLFLSSIWKRWMGYVNVFPIPFEPNPYTSWIRKWNLLQRICWIDWLCWVVWIGFNK
jgi:hypothetical protein